jgi:hypothetical protein
MESFAHKRGVRICELGNVFFLERHENNDEKSFIIAIIPIVGEGDFQSAIRSLSVFGGGDG